MSQEAPRGWPAAGTLLSGGPVDRWALLVGISDYAHDSLDLKFAARDASRLRDALLQPIAGAFPDDHVMALVDGEATLANLTKALRTFLKRPGPDDLVVVFFACHGSRDRDRPDNLYLLPHDTDPSDISGTALPMREVELALRETLLSRRVVVLVDTCHSGGLGDAFTDVRAIGDDAADLNTYLGALSDARGGVSLMTSAMASESSIEGLEWGGGHGIFTHFLLEGLQGKADRPPYDGVVTVGELFDYVAEQVQQATSGRQHPHISGSADRGLVLAVTGSLSANQHVDLARRLGEVAQLLDEPICWRGAAVQYAEAARLRPEEVRAQHGVEHALALWRAGDAAAAERALRALAPTQPGVRRTLGLVQLAQGRRDEAEATLLQPEPAEPWVPLLWSEDVGPGPRVAVLIGLDHVDPNAFGGWEGRLRTPVAEVATMGELLTREFGFDEVIELCDERATGDAVRSTVREVVQRSDTCDAIVVFLSGHGGEMPYPAERDGRDTVFVAWDTMIPTVEIDALLRSSRAKRTTVVASFGHSGRLAERAAGGGYEAIASCHADEVDLEGLTGLSLFMDALVPMLVRESDAGEVCTRLAQAFAAKKHPQHPQMHLVADRPVFVDAEPGRGGPGAVSVARVLLGLTTGADERSLDHVAELVAAGRLPAWAGGPLLTTLWRRRDRAQAAALPVDLGTSSIAVRAAAIGLAAHGLGAVGLQDALAALASAPSVAPGAELRTAMEHVASLGPVARHVQERLRVVLVGLSVLAGGVKGRASAPGSIEAVRHALEGWGVPPEHITVLQDDRATARAVRAALRRAGKERRREAVLVLWCGPGTLSELRCFDGATIDQTELVTLAGPDVSLLAEGPEPDARSGGPGSSGLRPRVVVLAPADGASTVWRSRLDGRRGKTRIGVLAVALVEALDGGADPIDLTASDLVSAAAQLRVLAEPGADRLVVNPFGAAVDAVTVALVRTSLEGTTDQLRQLLDQRNGVDPEAALQIGVLAHELGSTDAAVAALETAIAQFGADIAGQARARLQLGRVLLLSGQDRSRAASECRRAAELDPTLGVARFWHGKAIAELIRRETVAEATTALREYLELGAPAGYRTEAVALLGQLAQPGSATP